MKYVCIPECMYYTSICGHNPVASECAQAFSVHVLFVLKHLLCITRLFHKYFSRAVCVHWTSYFFKQCISLEWSKACIALSTFVGEGGMSQGVIFEAIF